MYVASSAMFLGSVKVDFSPQWVGMTRLSTRPIPAGKKILFIDIDGTLIDSYEGIHAGFIHALDTLNIPHPSESVMRSLAGPPMEETFASLGLTESQVSAAFDLYMEYARDGGWAQATAFPGVDKLLTQLKGRYYLATASSKGEGFARDILDHLGLLTHLDFLGAAQEYGQRRGKSAVIHYVLESLELQDRSADILMIGDRIHDIEGARGYGIDTVAVTWGYGNPTEWQQATTQANNPEELQEIIHEWSTS